LNDEGDKNDVEMSWNGGKGYVVKPGDIGGKETYSGLPPI